MNYICVRFLGILRSCIQSICDIFYTKLEAKDSVLVISNSRSDECRQWGFFSKKFAGRPRVLMAAGHGYGNVGDEAQCGACIKRWRSVAPDCRITLFSPNPAYTEALHGERSEWAPRVAWFRANTKGPYFGKSRLFIPFYLLLRIRLSISCRFMRAGIPFSLLLPREAMILHLLQQHDVLHISGGGFLTGKTRSRLWENCLLMRMCQLLNKPYMLTGHNIGVFQNNGDRKIARLGLAKARIIGLRDRGISEAELAEIGVAGQHVRSTCDDALLCERLEREAIVEYLKEAGVRVDKPWVAVQFHEWGQESGEQEKIRVRFAELCDHIVSKHNLQVVFIAMTPSDVEPEKKVLNLMKMQGRMAPYSPDYRVVRGIIAEAEFVFCMKHHPIVFAQGEGVPVVGVSLDEYYYHKNKGALDNTGHGDFLSHAKDFYESIPEQNIVRVIEKRQKIREEMLEWVKCMKAMELSDYEYMQREIIDA